MTSLSNLTTESCKVIAIEERYQGSYNVRIEYPNGWRTTHTVTANSFTAAKQGAIQQGNHDYRVSYDRLSYTAERNAR